MSNESPMKNKFVGYGVFLVVLVFGLMMTNSGVNKFLGYMPHPPLEPGARALADAFTATGYMWPAIAIAEIIGGLLVLTKRFRAVGAILLMPITINVLLLDAFLNQGVLWIGITVFALNVIVLASQKHKLEGLFANA